MRHTTVPNRCNSRQRRDEGQMPILHYPDRGYIQLLGIVEQQRRSDHRIARWTCPDREDHMQGRHAVWIEERPTPPEMRALEVHDCMGGSLSARMVPRDGTNGRCAQQLALECIARASVFDLIWPCGR